LLSLTVFVVFLSLALDIAAIGGCKQASAVAAVFRSLVGIRVVGSCSDLDVFLLGVNLVLQHASTEYSHLFSDYPRLLCRSPLWCSALHVSLRHPLDFLSTKQTKTTKT
ncbi:unnamed protein product, partial [Phaeothamnion confervicola]